MTKASHEIGAGTTEGFVTVTTAGHLFGFRLERVRDVFVPRDSQACPWPRRRSPAC